MEAIKGLLVRRTFGKARHDGKHVSAFSLAAGTLYGTIIQLSATAFRSAWVNTNSISLPGNSQVASWQDF